MMATITIKKVVPDVPFNRGFHDDRKRLMRTLRTGQGVLFLNKKKDKARLFCAAGGVHNYYAPPGEVFNLHLIQQQVKALSLTLRLTVKRSAMLRAA